MVILSAVVVMEPNRIAASKRVGKQINVCRNAASTTTKYTKWMDIYMYVLHASKSVHFYMTCWTIIGIKY